ARENIGDGDVVVAGALFPGHANQQMEDDGEPDPAILDADLDEQTTIMAEAGADLAVLEMITTTHWGRLATNAAADTGLPVWLGVSQVFLRWDGAPDFIVPYDPPGDAGEQVRLILQGVPEGAVEAVAVMHTEIEDVPTALDGIEPHWNGPLGSYPHFGRHQAEPPGFVSLPIDPADFAASAREWVHRGVQIIGGCCGIGPEHIKALKEELPTHIPESTRR
ncbi:MAG TPA: homocysteine S-methyltransferase family protein, partial [Baekduia sp.]|nr:homocysteine S-methyltransferase family protein [Baekduia sp.]